MHTIVSICIIDLILSRMYRNIISKFSDFLAKFYQFSVEKIIFQVIRIIFLLIPIEYSFRYFLSNLLQTKLVEFSLKQLA